jgi:hypothetical protein
MARKVADCREMPSRSGCTLTIAGEEDEVVLAVAMHAINVHGDADGPELQGRIRSLLKDGGPNVQGEKHGLTGTPLGEALLCRVMFGIPPLGESLPEPEGT